MTDLNILNPLKMQDSDETGDDKQWDEKEGENGDEEEEEEVSNDEGDYLE